MATILLLAFAGILRCKERNWSLRRYKRVDMMLREVGNTDTSIPVHMARHWAQLASQQLDP
jgi:hypothetical protein